MAQYLTIDVLPACIMRVPNADKATTNTSQKSQIIADLALKHLSPLDANLAEGQRQLLIQVEA